MDTQLKNFGLAMRRRRLKRRLTQTELGRAVGVSPNQICNIEYGSNWPAMPVYIAICRKLGVNRIPFVQ